jgi:YaiO family outer membrane protein
MKSFLFSYLSIFLIVVCGHAGVAGADQPTSSPRPLTSSTKATPPGSKPHRLEMSYTFENLHPNDDYGDWHSGQISFYSRVASDFTYFLQAVGHHRDEGSGATGTVGAYKDWLSWLYTYTAATMGTDTDYLPELRLDHDFNFKTGPGQCLVLTAGVTYVDYYDDHRDWILSGGPTFYLNRWVLQYRFFYNQSDPGSVDSTSHLVSVGYGEEGRQWSYLNVSFGNQAYQATYLETPEEFNEDSLMVMLLHRHWLGEDYGIFGDVSYYHLDDSYEKYGASLGVFYEF